MIFAALLALAAAGATPPAPAQGPVRVNISPAGQEVLKKAMTRVDPDTVTLLKKRDGIGDQIAGLTTASKLDLVRLAALLHQQEQVEGAIRARANLLMLNTLKSLSEADRVAFLRSMAEARRAAKQAAAARR